MHTKCRRCTDAAPVLELLERGCATRAKPYGKTSDQGIATVPALFYVRFAGSLVPRASGGDDSDRQTPSDEHRSPPSHTNNNNNNNRRHRRPGSPPWLGADEPRDAPPKRSLSLSLSARRAHMYRMGTRTLLSQCVRVRCRCCCVSNFSRYILHTHIYI